MVLVRLGDVDGERLRRRATEVVGNRRSHRGATVGVRLGRERQLATVIELRLATGSKYRRVTNVRDSQRERLRNCHFVGGANAHVLCPVRIDLLRGGAVQRVLVEGRLVGTKGDTGV